MQNDSTMSANAVPTTSSPSMLSAAATPASATVTPEEMEEGLRVQRITSSALLMSFAHALFSARILPSSGQMHLGLGGDFAQNSNVLVTLCCPSDSGRVALALTTEESGCSCSPHYRTPTARDWKGMSAKSWRTRVAGDKTPTLPDQLGGVPHPEFVEALMGFPIGASALKP